MLKRISLSNWTLLASILVMLFVASNLNLGKDYWRGIIESDAKGYYAYLPAIFIYHDLNFGFFDAIEKEKYYHPNLYYDYRAKSNDKVINKYFCGTALAELPFFLMAHYLSSLFGYDADGFSKLYPLFVNLAALFYLFLGLFFLRKTLKLYACSEFSISFSLLVALFGTNLFYYCVVEPGMSHVFSFGLISAFLYLGKSYFIYFNQKYLLRSLILLGMIVLIRPTNGLIVLSVPFLAGSVSVLKTGISKALHAPLNLGLGVFLFAIIASIQLIIYKISTGSFFVYSYGDEHFNFAEPHLLDLFFSYKKGLFLYTPLYLVSLWGCYFMWKRNGYEFITFVAFLFIVSYILSSWWMWYYGGSFSSRVFVDYISVFMIGLGIALTQMHSKFQRLSVGILLSSLILICQFQTYQYRYYIIHWSDMNKERYWDVFLRVDQVLNLGKSPH